MGELVLRSGEEQRVADPADEPWLAELARRARVGEHLVRGGPVPGPLLDRRAPGLWRVAPVVGELWMHGRRLRIVAPGHAGLGVATVLGSVWCAELDRAARHGPPAFHADRPHRGASLRGRLDVRATVRLRASGSSQVASSYRARDLDNDIARAIVAADRVLTRQIGGDRWRSQRAREVLPQMRDAVGRRSRLPTIADLGRIRYSPITRPFRDIAELSVRIVEQDPVMTTTERGRPQGILVGLDLVA
jgi:5-methylcytosine-specific restriction enzyme subunit McrC